MRATKAFFIPDRNLTRGSLSTAMPEQNLPKPSRRQPLRPRHVPQRTCVACHRTGPKRELVRIVRGLDGAVQVDSTGKRAGRGAYLCRNPACWELAFRRKALEHALSTTISAEERAVLLEYAERLRQEPVEGEEK